jgi:hypothetical protein
MKGSEPAEMYEKLKGYSSPDEDEEEDATPDPLLFSGSEDVYRLSEADALLQRILAADRVATYVDGDGVPLSTLTPEESTA